MSTHADKLETAKILIKEHIKNNFTQLTSLGNPNIAVHCICKDLEIDTDAVLTEIARQTYNEFVINQQTKEKGQTDPKKMTSIEKDSLIVTLHKRLELGHILSQKLAKDAEFALDAMASENEHLCRKLEKLERKPGLFARIFGRLLSKPKNKKV